MGRRGVGDPEAEPGEEQAESHQRKGAQEQVPSTKGINRVERRQCEQPVDDTETQRRTQGTDFGQFGLKEDLRRVVRNDVDTTELLHEHCYLGRNHGVAVAADREQLLEAVALADALGHFLGIEQGAHVEEVSRGLDLLVSQLAECFVRVVVPVLGQVPAGRLGVEGDHAADDDGGDSG